MCGICGIVGPGAACMKSTVEAMCRALVHRGPDAQGIASGPGWVLGHRRLRIIDLSDQAAQPMYNEDHRVCLTYNGEIYNYESLRPGLLREGHVLVSRSDTDVVLHQVESGWEKALETFNGMFALACIDAGRRRVLLARDRTGIKPLYYARVGPNLVFASEIKALFCHPGLHPALNRGRVRELLQYRAVTGPDTAFAGIRELPAGHCLDVSLEVPDGDPVAYWRMETRATVETVGAETVRSALDRSVRRHMISDVPVGAQLSGGLDSSLVTALAAAATGGVLHTYSIGFTGTRQDESGWARNVAGYLGTCHHAISYTERDFLEDLFACVRLNDEPLCHPASPAMYRLCREAGKEVRVLLTGEGADELFGGYSWHRRAWKLDRVGALARLPVWRYAGRLVRLSGRWGRGLSWLGLPPTAVARLAGQWITDEAMRILWQGPEDGVAREPAAGGEGPEERRLWALLLANDLHHYLPPILQRQDRMSMGFSIESRVPFLDSEMLSLASRLTGRQLFGSGYGKRILREAASGLVPETVIQRSKIGFALPLGAWLRNPNGLGRHLEWLYSDRAAARGLWRVEPVRRWVQEHTTGRTDHADILWSLLAVEMWCRAWLEGDDGEVFSVQ